MLGIIGLHLLRLLRMYCWCGSACTMWRLLQTSNGQSELSSSSSSPRDIPSPPIKLAGLILRRKEGRECGPSSRTSLPYKQDDYEVLLRRWTKTPYVGQLCMPSGPMVQGSSPEATLLNEAQGWTTKLAARAEMKKTKGLKGTARRLSV